MGAISSDFWTRVTFRTMSSSGPRLKLKLRQRGENDNLTVVRFRSDRFTFERKLPKAKSSAYEPKERCGGHRTSVSPRLG